MTLNHGVKSSLATWPPAGWPSENKESLEKNVTRGFKLKSSLTTLIFPKWRVLFFFLSSKKKVRITLLFHVLSLDVPCNTFALCCFSPRVARRGHGVGGAEMLVISSHGIPAVCGPVTGMESPIYHLLNLWPGLVWRLSLFHLGNEAWRPGVRISSENV